MLDSIWWADLHGELCYIELDEVVEALNNRPKMQSVIITGRGAHRTLTEMADTVSEVRNVNTHLNLVLKRYKALTGNHLQPSSRTRSFFPLEDDDH